MNKQCKACGSNVPNEAKFCQVCGGADFLFFDPQQQNGVNFNANPNQTGYAKQLPVNQPGYAQPPVNQPGYAQPPVNQPGYTQQPPVNQPWQPPVPQNQPKKKKTGLIIGIVAGVLVVLAIIGAVAQKVFQDQGYGDDTGSYDDYDYNYDYDVGGDDSSEDDYYEEPDEVKYTKGTFDGSVYANEWADIQLALPAGFSDADASTYASAESATTECGAYFMADDTTGLIYICFEKLPTFPVYDEEEYLDALLNSLATMTEVTYNVPDVYSTTVIGGYAYTTAKCTFTNAYGTFYDTIYVRKLDDHIILISSAGETQEDCDALAGNITSVN